MTTRTRIAAYGGTVLLVVAGALCAALITSETGQVVGFSLIGAALIFATGLVFLEVGLSEDRERARERQAAVGRRSAAPRHAGESSPRRIRGPRRRLR